MTNESLANFGIPALEYIGIGATFVFTAMAFYGLKSNRWVYYLLLVSLVGQCVLAIGFKNDLELKLFAVMMLNSAFMTEVYWRRKRRLAAKLR